ncbi:MAG: hypothetical protein AB1765_12490 [Candidatus Hydrogenedentota bacterium]
MGIDNKKQQFRLEHGTNIITTFDKTESNGSGEKMEVFEECLMVV